MILTFLVGILAGSILGYRMRSRQAEIEHEAERIQEEYWWL